MGATETHSLASIGKGGHRLGVLIVDVDGVRSIHQGGGMDRLQRSLREQPSFVTDDEIILAHGYSRGGAVS